MKVLLASPRGFCAGVKRAIEIVNLALSAERPPVYVRKEIVHNRFVVEDLRHKGTLFVEELSQVPENSTVIFSAHGVAPHVREEARARKLHVIDATCPLVTKVHEEAVNFLNRGFELILVGHSGHDEVIGTMGEAPNRIKLVTCVAEAKAVSVSDPKRLGVLTQTTLSTDDTIGIMKILKERFPALHLPPSDDICYATRNRQQAVKALAAQARVILVIGAQNSSNSIRLREVAEDSGAMARLINHVGEMDWSWLGGVSCVGVTAGASAPESVVQELVNTIVHRFSAGIEEIIAVKETVRFMLPAELDSGHGLKQAGAQ